MPCPISRPDFAGPIWLRRSGAYGRISLRDWLRGRIFSQQSGGAVRGSEHTVRLVYNFALNMMNYVLNMMDFVLNMDNKWLGLSRGLVRA